MKKIETFVKIVGAGLILTISFLALANEAKSQTKADTLRHCAGIKADKTPCKSTFIVKGTNYCSAHNPAPIHCAGKNSKKEPCKMTVKQAGEFCRFHKEN